MLNITHADNPLKRHLESMQDYMPPQHRDVLHHLETQTAANKQLMNIIQRCEHITAQYNHCIAQVNRFRQTHYRYAAQYINSQKQQHQANPIDVGTGGTPFMPYLKKHQIETADKESH